jgi:hypothetical protein
MMDPQTFRQILDLYPPGSPGARFWEEYQQECEAANPSGEFWADRVKRLKREKKYEEALETMKGVPPFPAVAYERIICIRHLVRATRKAGEDCSQLLQLLYENAVQTDALSGEPAITLTRVFPGESEPRTYPGFNVAKIFHALAARHGLPLEYQSVGYEHVQSLNQSDRKWVVEAWGEPAQHLDPSELYRPLWEVARELYTRETEAQEAQSRKEWEQLRAEIGLPPKRPVVEAPKEAAETPKKRRWFGLFG